MLSIGVSTNNVIAQNPGIPIEHDIIDDFMFQMSEAMTTADLQSQYDEYKVFLDDWWNLDDLKSLDLKYNFFAGLHYLTYETIDEQNIKWIIRKYATIFTVTLGWEDTKLEDNDEQWENFDYITLWWIEINIKKLCDEWTAQEQIQFLKDMFNAISSNSKYKELDNGYNINNIQGDLESVDENKLKIVNMVDFLDNNDAWKILSKKVLIYIKDNDVNTLLEDINLLNGFLTNEEFQTKYNEDYNNLENSGKSKNELSLETLLSLPNEDKKEMVKLFLERITFVGGSINKLKKRKKLVRWIDKSEDIEVNIWNKTTIDLANEYCAYIDILESLNLNEEFNRVSFWNKGILKRTATPRNAELFQDLIWEEYGKALCGETKEWKDITYQEIKDAEADLEPVQKWQLMSAIISWTTTLSGIDDGQQYLTGTWIAQWLPDLTKKNENIKKYNEKLENRLAKLKWTGDYFEQEYISNKLDEEKEQVKNEKEQVNEENDFIHLVEDITTESRTITNDELEKRNNFLKKYDNTYPLYDTNSALITIFKNYYKKNHKNQ